MLNISQPTNLQLENYRGNPVLTIRYKLETGAQVYAANEILQSFTNQKVYFENYRQYNDLINKISKDLNSLQYKELIEEDKPMKKQEIITTL